MNSLDLLNRIKENLKDYPIDYLKKKASDDRYPDSISKRLAIYNSSVYDEIFESAIDDFEVREEVIKNLSEDVDYYFSVNDPYDDENREFTKNLCLYLALIAKKPLHPVGDPSSYHVYELNGEYKCKDRILYLKDKRSLCRYCICKNAGYGFF
ncbi:DUF2115 family protein [uncultured Methanobrevibacter sp.]|uniref:DUF2115 family protein n=1 Tax=uncultured Methanobrevibacter sp. TaxID=253161 RepID=UPI00260AB815